MKFLNIILSIYLVALSCLPCADMEAKSVGKNDTNAIAKTTDDHNEHSHDKDKDLCSPFCSCNCCGSQIVSYFNVMTCNFAVVSKEIKTQLPSYTSKFTSNFYGSIWQPPQIA